MIDRSSLNPFLRQYSSQVEPPFAAVTLKLINDGVWRWTTPPVLASLPGRSLKEPRWHWEDWRIVPKFSQISIWTQVKIGSDSAARVGAKSPAKSSFRGQPAFSELIPTHIDRAFSLMIT
jgi:hypothetical protein